MERWLSGWKKSWNPLKSSQPKSFDPRLQTRISSLIASTWWLLQMPMVKGSIRRISVWSSTGNHRWIWRCDLNWLWVWDGVGKKSHGEIFVVTCALIQGWTLVDLCTAFLWGLSLCDLCVVLLFFYLHNDYIYVYYILCIYKYLIYIYTW